MGQFLIPVMNEESLSNARLELGKLLEDGMKEFVISKRDLKLPWFAHLNMLMGLKGLEVWFRPTQHSFSKLKSSTLPHHKDLVVCKADNHNNNNNNNHNKSELPTSFLSIQGPETPWSDIRTHKLPVLETRQFKELHKSEKQLLRDRISPRLHNNIASVGLH